MGFFKKTIGFWFFSKKPSTLQISKQEAFRESLDDLSDIAHEKALQKIEIEEDRDFLLAQQEKGHQAVESCYHAHPTIQSKSDKR